jgi:DNA-binding SARP family transcriptional activator
LADLQEFGSDRRLVVVVDDLHTVRGRPADEALARLVEYLPDHVHVVVGTRALPSFDLTALRLDGRLLEIGADDLRFRTWETEQLLSELYRLDLGPEDVARLTRRVEGWAAGLQLYHLAVRNKPPREQRRLIDVASSRSTLARQYLTRNVLDTLRPELSRFLLDTSVLGLVSGRLADELLERSASATLLDELVQLQLFVTPLDHELHRYHEVLRSHLESLLGEEIGAEALRARLARAAQLLEHAGHIGEALRCAARAERWDDVRRLVGIADADPLTQSFAWLDLLPPGIGDDDPWLLLARARAELAAGRLSAAIARFRRAEILFGDAPDAEAARSTRRRIEHILDGSADEPADWVGTWRRGLRTDPRGAAARLDADAGADALLGAGVLHLAVGDTEAADTSFDRALRAEPLPMWVEIAGALGRATTRLIAHPDDELARRSLLHVVDRADAEWFARVGRSILGGGRSAEVCAADGDPWGRLIALFSDGLRALARGADAITTFETAVAQCRDLGAPVVEAVVLDALSVAQERAGDPAFHDTARAAERLRASAQPRPAPSVESYRPAIERICGPATAPPRTATVRCLGGFSVLVGHQAVDLHALRPRARSVLHLLALHADQPLHRDTILDALWPEVDVAAGLRSLQVAVSAIRKELSGTALEIERTADGYLLATAGVGTDTQRLVTACGDVHAARRRGDHSTATEAALEIVTSLAGELLPEEGPADWVVGERDRLRQLLVAAAVAGADSALECGQPDVAVEIAQRALHAERYDDRAWRVLIDATEAAGDTCAAARAREGYAAMLDDLGVPATSRAGTRAR